MNRVHLLVILILLLAGHGALAAILRFPQDYQTLQAAVDASSRGDTVLVGEGEHFESCSIENTSLTLAGEYIFTQDTLSLFDTRNAADNECLLIYADLEQGDTLAIKGLTFVCYGGENVSAIDVEAANSVFQMDHCFIINFHNSEFGKVDLSNANSEISCCAFVDNGDSTRGNVLCLIHGSAWIHHCFFDGNRSSEGGAIRSIATDLTVEYSVFEQNYSFWYGGALYSSGMDGETVLHRNRFYLNSSSNRGTAVAIASQISVDINACQFFSNTGPVGVVGGGAALYLLSDQTYYEVYKNSFWGNRNECDGAAVNFSGDTNFHDNLVTANKAHQTPAIQVMHANDWSTRVDAWNNRFESNGPLENGDEDYSGAIVVQHSNDSLLLFNNDFFNHVGCAVGWGNEHPGYVTATGNYWGHESGPRQLYQNPGGQGDSVAAAVPILPFAEQPLNNFTPPDEFSLRWPLNESTNDTFPVRFSWWQTTDPDPDNSIDYLLEISSDPWFNDARRYYFQQGDSRIVADLAPGFTYYWRVTAYDDVWQSRQTDCWRVHITETDFPPRAFDLVFPSDHYCINYENIEFQWNKAYDFTPDDTIRYAVEYDTSRQFTTPACFEAGLDTFCTIPWETWTLYPQYWWRVKATDLNGNETYSSEERMVFLSAGVDETVSDIPTSWNLTACFPNPFNSSTNFTVCVPENGILSINVFDILGRKVDNVASGSITPGFHRFIWNAEDKPAGCYFLQVRNHAGWEQNRRLVFLK